MLDNALYSEIRIVASPILRTHWDPTPYFVQGINRVFLWRFLQLFRTYRGRHEFVHWKGRFEIAQKRLLASWTDLIDLTDLPDGGTAEFLAAFTDAQREHFQNLANDEERMNYQVTLREQTITNRRAQHQNAFPLSDNLMSLTFLVQSDLNEQQRERFVSSMNIRQIAMPQYTYLQVKQLFLELFCASRNGVVDPNISHRKRSSFRIIDEGETEEGEHAFWVIDEETGEEGFTRLFTETDFWVLVAKGTYSKRRLYGRSFKKGKPKGYGKKGKRSRPGFRPRSKGKGYAAWDNDQQDKAFWGKGKGKKGKKGMKGKDSFKGMPSWKGKGKGDGKNQGGKQFQQQIPSFRTSSPRNSRSCPSRRNLELRLWHLLDRWLVNMRILLWILSKWLVRLVLLCFRWGTDHCRGQAFGRLSWFSSGRTDGPKQPVLFFCYLLVPMFRTRTHVLHAIHVFVRVSPVPELPSFQQETNSEHPIHWREHRNPYRWQASERTAHLPTQIR